MSQTQRSLEQTLSQLEKIFLAPHVSGEVEVWLDEVDATVQELETVLDRRIKNDHQTIFDDIGTGEPELLPRVEKLRNEDAEIQGEVESLRREAGSLRKLAAEAEPDEQKFEGHVDQLADRGLQLILRIKKQEEGLNIWYLESVDRDYGLAD